METNENKETIKEKDQAAKDLTVMQEIYGFVNSEGYKRFKAVLVKKLVIEDSCSTLIDNLSIQQAGEIALIRKKAIKLIADWLVEAEGEANAYPQMLKLIGLEKEDNIITREVKGD